MNYEAEDPQISADRLAALAANVAERTREQHSRHLAQAEEVLSHLEQADEARAVVRDTLSRHAPS